MNTNILYSIKIRTKTLKLDNTEVNKKEFHASKQPISLNFVNVNQISISGKSKQYFIGYKDGNIMRPLCIILPQMTGCMKSFENVGKIMSFIIKMIMYWQNIMKFLYKIKKALNIKFNSMSVFDETYTKAKVKKFTAVVNTNLIDNEVPKKICVTLVYIACICIASVMKMGKKNYPQVSLEESKYRLKKKKIPEFIEVELESDSDSEWL